MGWKEGRSSAMLLLERLVRIPAGSELGVAMTVHERGLDKSSSQAASIIGYGASAACTG
ncbi:hypothetical protein EMIT0P294_30305 [Pseudomonas sp. IT-P294]